ncbi:MAG: TlpA disulfide reductase family protein [Ginsengibacter sp.]
MKQLLVCLLACILFSCGNKSINGEFTVSGNIKNAEDQKLYLEEISFNQKPPLIIDTTDLKGGKFSIKTNAPEEGLYRLRLEKADGYIFINDRNDLSFTADAKDSTQVVPAFNTPANVSISNFIVHMDSIQRAVVFESQKYKQFQDSNAPDSILQIGQNRLSALSSGYNNFLLNYVDTTKSPVIALFALGYTENVNVDTLTNVVARLTSRFPQHKGVAAVVHQFDSLVALQRQSSTQPSNLTMAPDIVMPDTTGKTFSLSSLKGKYVLVDFWASWCGPCRGENPNVVSAFQKFKNKNFTILGVSLDQDKAAWLKAVNKDKLTWHQISDLKGWESAAVPLYNIEGIPFNVLVDPQGKIIAQNLRGEDLQQKLATILR